MIHHLEDARNIGDILSGLLAVGTLAQLLPQIAAVLSIGWTLIRIAEWIRSKMRKRRIDPLDL